MKATQTLVFTGTILGLCMAGGAANAQRGAVSDFSGAGVASSAFIGSFHPRAAAQARNAAFSAFAVRAFAFRLGSSLNSGTVAGGGLTTSGFGVQALGQLLSTAEPAPAVRQKIADALRPSGALAPQVDRLLAALTGLLANPAAPALEEGPRSGLLPGGRPLAETGGPSGSPAGEDASGRPRPAARESSRTTPLSSDPSAAAVQRAGAAFRDFVNSASAQYLSDPPEVFRAIFSTLFELICSENAASGITAPACTPPNYVINQPPPVPLVNRDSIAAAARDSAAAAKVRADSAAAAAARAHADSVASATRRLETARARAVIETRVFFDADQFALDAGAKAALDAKIPVLKANPDLRIRVVGNVDQQESGAFNHLLGKFRAEQARSYLIAHGVGVNRIEIVDNGAAHPVCTERRESCRSRNRRDEFVIVAGGAQLTFPE